MKTEIDWSKAPEGFDFCLIGKSRCGHPKFYMGEVDRYVSQSGNFVAYVDAGEFDIFHRPKEPWTGDGYPPVGTLCEYRNTESGVWGECEIVAFRKGAWVVFDSDCETDFVTLESLRPRRTPEQIAADERNKACDKMFGVILDKIPQGRRNNGSDICEALYDAGYRKFEIVDEQP